MVDELSTIKFALRLLVDSSAFVQFYPKEF